MSKLNTIQKRHKLNEVKRVGVVGPGNAYHEYQIIGKGSEIIQTISFQNGPRNGLESKSGVLDTDLLEIVRDRLICFQNGDYRCRENDVALTHIEEALLWLNKRVEDRVERNVLGTTRK